MGNAGNSTAAVAALGELGITDNVILNNILNTSYDTQYVSTAEAAKAFENQNPDYIPTEAEIESFVSNRPDSEVATLVASYIDKRYLDVDEVKAAAEASGITLTDEQAEKFVGQNPDETEALNAAIAEIEDKSLFYTDADGNNVFAGYYPDMGDSDPIFDNNRPPFGDKPSSGEVPDGITPPPAGSITSPVMVDYVNEITGETYSAPNSGYTPVEGSGWVVKPPASGTLPVEDPKEGESDFTPFPDIPDDDFGELIPSEPVGDDAIFPMPIGPTPDDSVDELIPSEPVDDPLTADDVKDIIDTAIGNLPESASPEDVSSAIEDALAGMNNLSDADVSSAIEDALADMNNLSSEDVQDIVDEATGVNAEAISDLETSLTELIEENNGDVSAALDELATAMGVGEASILEELGTTEANLTDKFETGISGVEESVSNLETNLTALIEENNGDVNAALDELADDLGTTEANILEELGTTEANLTEKFETGISGLEGSIGTLSSDLAALGLDVDTIADLIGKPARKVTETDIDFVIDLIAQENVSEELITQYDVTGDGIVDINDQNMLSDKLQGNDVTFADTSMFNPATGLYAEMDTKNDAVTDMITDMNTQINTQTNQQNFAEFQKLLAESDDIGGQRVDVKSGDKVKLDYLYDIGGESIFATPQQESMFGSPFGQRDVMQPANQTLRPFSRASGFAQGGQVEDENDMLLRILGET